MLATEKNFLVNQKPKEQQNVILCHHCGLHCENPITLKTYRFCCHGCKTAFQILTDYQLDSYYLKHTKSNQKIESHTEIYDILDDEKEFKSWIQFEDERMVNCTLSLSSIHCYSCVWLLENLSRINSGILHPKVDYLKKKLSFNYLKSKTHLKDICRLLSDLGYPPHKSNEQASDRDSWARIGLTAFCFLNTMSFSFPEYLSNGEISSNLSSFFSLLCFILSIPIILYSSRPILSNALKATLQQRIVMDTPIALGILAMYGTSLYAFFTKYEQGYFDSFSALVLFILIARKFQDTQLKRLEYQTNLKNYFPLHIEKKLGNDFKVYPLEKLKKGDHFLIRHNCVIPAESKIISGEAKIDYSFINGESSIHDYSKGNHLFVGGIQQGGKLILECLQTPSPSFLQQIWGGQHQQKYLKWERDNLNHKIAQYFLPCILLIALSAGIYSYTHTNIFSSLETFAAVLIVACPCALAIAVPLAMGQGSQYLAEQGFYFSHPEVISICAHAKNIVFDKTGTLTSPEQQNIKFKDELNEEQSNWIASLAQESSHPICKLIQNHFSNAKKYEIQDFKEIPNQGISGWVQGHYLQIGNPKKLSTEYKHLKHQNLILLDHKYLSAFDIESKIDPNIISLIHSLKSNFDLHLLSGDTERDRQIFKQFFPKSEQLHFNISPDDKKFYISKLKQQKGLTLMIGDGLNDRHALEESDVGICIVKQIQDFRPSCNAILEQKALNSLPEILIKCKKLLTILRINVAISLAYNLVGIGLAFFGYINPLICAILMPLSSATVIFTSTFLTRNHIKASWKSYLS